MGCKGTPYSRLSRKKEKNFRKKANSMKSLGRKQNAGPSSVGDVNSGKFRQIQISGVSNASQGDSSGEVSGESSNAAAAACIKDEYFVTGRRIVDIAIWFKQIAMLDTHSSMKCQFSDFEVISENLEGLRSGFTVRCKKCHFLSVVWTDDPEKESEKMDINLNATEGILSIGGCYSKLEQFCGSLNMPSMTSEDFFAHEKHLAAASEERESAPLEEANLTIDCRELHGDGVSLPPVVASGSWTKRSDGTNNSVSGMDSSAPPVAEPVQVFVNVPVALIESSNIAPEEVDPLEVMDTALDHGREKGMGKRPLDQAVHENAFLHQAIKSEEGTRDVTEPQGCNDQLDEFVAYSLQSDVVFSNEDGDEKPVLGLESFCCSLENCNRMFDNLEELNSHQRSCHLSVMKTNQFGSRGDWHQSVPNEMKLVSQSERNNDKLPCEGLSRGCQLKPGKRRRNEKEDYVNKTSTKFFSDNGIGLRRSHSDCEYVNGHPHGDANILISGDSSDHLEAPIDADAMVKVERTDDVEQDVLCADSKFFCEECSVTFTEELSLKKHFSEMHLKSNEMNCGVEGEQSFQSVGKLDSHIANHDVPTVVLLHDAHKVGHPENISSASELRGGGGTVSGHWTTGVKTIPRVVGSFSIPGVGSAVSFEGRMCMQSGQMYGSADVCNQTRNISDKSFSGCGVCGRPIDASGDSHLENNGGWTSRICKPCEGSLKCLPVVNNQRKKPRPHQCHICGQAFVMKFTLKRHERVHTGERPFLCSICSRSYTRNEHLKEHLKSHHLKDENQSTS